jgi:equilibrative nucleoside transporter 1/2/3
MDRMRLLAAKPADDAEYQPLQRDEYEENDSETLHSISYDTPFSWLEYTVFMLVGVAMLWAWSVFPLPLLRLAPNFL